MIVRKFNTPLEAATAALTFAATQRNWVTVDALPDNGWQIDLNCEDGLPYKFVVTT